MIYDLIIVGGGPAGTAGAVYAARKKIKTLLLVNQFGGQSIVSPDIQNWIGIKSISGEDLAQKFKDHAYAYQGEDLVIKEGLLVEKVSKIGDNFEVKTTDQETFNARTILIATGANRRHLTVPGADTFEQKGLTYCATCDGPLFAGKEVAVIGGGNAGFETAAQLLAYCSKVTILDFSPVFKADEITIKSVLSNPRAQAINNAEILEIKGDKLVTSLVYKDRSANELKEIPVGGIFVEIGAIPATDLVKDLVALTPGGQIKTDPTNQRASLLGVWAAGDCTNSLYQQNNIAAGDAVKALEDIYSYLQKKTG